MKLKSRASDVIRQVLSDPWEYAEADTQTLTHNVHRYSGKFIPQIALRAIQLLCPKGGIVFDPYCGSGTTLLECALSNRVGIGMDMSPLAVLIASVKTTPVPGRLLEEFVKGIVTKLNTKQLAPELPLFDGSELDESPYDSGVSADPRLADSWYSKWFQPHVLRELLLVDGIVSGVGDVRLQRIAKVALSNVLRRSSNAHSGYPNVMFDRRAPKKPLPIRGFLRELEKVAEQVRSLETMADELRAVRVLQGDAGRAPIASGTVDAVVSHPPYIGSIPYAEYGALSLRWLGADPKALDNRLTGGKRQSRDVVARFSVGYSSMLQECARVLKPGGFAFLMVGNPVVRGELVDLAEMTRVLAGQSGFDLVVETTREGVNRRANKMGAEHLLFFERRAEI